MILKGAFGELRHRGIEQWIEEMARHVDQDLAGHLHAHAGVTQKPFLLDSVSDCVRCWSTPGSLVIGDAAHTMSPVGGQGINIALRDAIVTANHLVPAMTGTDQTPKKLHDALCAIEDERMPEVSHIQALQARPPEILLNRAWWGEPVRRLAALALSQEKIRSRVAGQVAAFPFGVTQVRLRV
ncbi:MAG: FAD-dependent monooxygenase [Proteobacteria bacterium]|nr:FAD-dependent monooxygenase [Pseudomonadota bacterium]